MNTAFLRSRAQGRASTFVLFGALVCCLWSCDALRGEVGVYEPKDAAADATILVPVDETNPDSPVDDPAEMTEETAAIVPIIVDETGPDNPAGLSQADVKDLLAGGPTDEMTWLYPYEGTVFPRGMLAPLIMWNGDPAVDAVYLRITSRAFSYRGILKPTTQSGLWLPFGLTGTWTSMALAAVTGALATQLPIPQHVWDLAGKQTLGKTDIFTLELTERIDGQIHGPIAAHVRIAQAELKGSVYYDSCLSTLQGGTALDWLTGPSAAGRSFANLASGSKVLRIPPGGTAELVLSDPGTFDGRCQGCHAVSANGSRLTAQQSMLVEDGASLLTGFVTPSGQGLSYPFTSDNSPASRVGVPVGPNASYGTLYPDGSKYLSSSSMVDIGLVSLFAGPSGLLQSLVATLYDTTTGAVVTGTQIPEGALMPMFSPDGRLLVFNDPAIGDAHGLALMNYDTGTNKASGYRVLVKEDPESPHRPGWPSFLPDNNAVVFARTDGAGFSSTGTGLQAIANGNPLSDLILLPGASSDLYLTDATSGGKLLLARAMGFDNAADAEHGTTYLPFRDDLHHNYLPHVAPVAAGGYFWVFFDSLRHYGNLGKQRALWAFAVEIASDGHYTSDPSQPPFYLPGQEFGSTNHHAVAALDKCRPDAELCKSGMDCCGGRCRSGRCSAAEDSCARIDERCSLTADCCPSRDQDPRVECIATFCAVVPSVQ